MARPNFINSIGAVECVNVTIDSNINIDIDLVASTAWPTGGQAVPGGAYGSSGGGNAPDIFRLIAAGRPTWAGTSSIHKRHGGGDGAFFPPPQPGDGVQASFLAPSGGARNDVLVALPNSCVPSCTGAPSRWQARPLPADKGVSLTFPAVGARMGIHVIHQLSRPSVAKKAHHDVI